MNFDKLLNRNVILFTKKDFRYEGEIRAVDEDSIEIYDIVKKKLKQIKKDEISEADEI